MEKIDQTKTVEKAVELYFEANSSSAGISRISLEERKHIIQTGAKIMLTKWGLTSGEGNFVDAFVSDKLSKTYACADDTNMKAIRFYCLLSYNMAAPHELFEK